MAMLNFNPAENSRSRLLEAAIFCFSEKGYDATGIREIAQRAKANSALVQYHFGGKEALYLATLALIFDHNHSEFPSIARAPQSREEAIQGIREIIRQLILELLECEVRTPLEQAALLLVTREMQSPRPESIPLVLDHIKPFQDNLGVCLKVLLPDLDNAQTLDLMCSIYGPIFHLHSSLALMRILRNDASFPHEAKELERLTTHLTEFSLRGIGIPEAFPQQGV